MLAVEHFVRPDIGTMATGLPGGHFIGDYRARCYRQYLAQRWGA